MEPREPVSLRQYADRKDSKPGRHRKASSGFQENFSTLYCADIQGARPKQYPTGITKSYSSLRNDDIAGTKPRLHYCKSERTPFSLRTDDIRGASNYKYYEKKTRQSPRNPLEPFEQSSPLGTKGELKYFGPKPKTRFVRDSIAVADIPGAVAGDKYKKYTTRDNIGTADIEGASVKVINKVFYDKEQLMGLKEEPKKKISQLRENKFNPLSPRYKIGKDRHGKEIHIGEITQQRPKGSHKRKLSKRDNIPSTIQSVEWMPNQEKYKPKMFIKPVAGAPSATCNQSNLFVQIESRGKKKYGSERGTLEGIMETPVKQRIHVTTKPPVYKQPKRALQNNKKF